MLCPEDIAQRKLNIAAVGIGGMGRNNIAACAATENIVALCDVDSAHAERIFNQYPGAARFVDYRKMFDDAADQFDAVICATPDHTHAVICMAAIQHGSIYSARNLAHTLHEVRAITLAAREAESRRRWGIRADLPTRSAA